MVASDETQIPLLTDIVEGGNSFESIPRRNRSQAEATMDIETTIAELQTRLASRTYALTDELLRAAFADMEASVFRQLPELIDSVLREQLKQDGD
jgi:hypothetical protein